MADQELGGVAVPGTFTISLPTDYPKKIEKAVMSDGSFRWAFFKKSRKWKLSWVVITNGELTGLIARYAIDAITTWKNTDERVDVIDVVITDFSYDCIDPGNQYYKATMSLEEAI